MALLFLENYRFVIVVNDFEKIGKSDDSSAYMTYEIQVYSDHFGLWLIKSKRYSDFLHLKSIIDPIAKTRSIRLPSFPPKGILTRFFERF